MGGRITLPVMALSAAFAVAMSGCTAPKPRPDKRVEEAAERQRAHRAVREGIEKEKVTSRAAAAARDGQLRSGDSIWMQPGKSKVLRIPFNVTRVSIGNPDLAGVVVLGPRSILVNAKEFTREDPNTRGGSGTRVSRAGVLSSRTLTPPPQIEETTIILWDGDNRTESHTLYVADFSAEQVLLEVTIAELNRTKLEARGVDFQSLGDKVRAGYWLGGGDVLGNIGFLPGADPPTIGPVFPLTLGPERPTFAFQSGDGDITALVTMLQQEGLATVLAQPKILALSGQYAVFQVGGEIPIRIVTSFSAEVEFKAFGTLVNFLPRVADDGEILLTVTPEVSAPDFNSLVEGVPSFRTRRASTSAKLREGETLVIGGLTQRTRIESERGLPYLKDIPYVGQLFRDTTFTEETTELMVIVTPHLVKPIRETLDLPTDRGPLSREESKTKASEAEVTRPRLPTPAHNSRKQTNQ